MLARSLALSGGIQSNRPRSRANLIEEAQSAQDTLRRLTHCQLLTHRLVQHQSIIYANYFLTLCSKRGEGGGGRSEREDATHPPIIIISTIRDNQCHRQEHFGSRQRKLC